MSFDHAAWVQAEQEQVLKLARSVPAWQTYATTKAARLAKEWPPEFSHLPALVKTAIREVNHA